MSAVFGIFRRDGEDVSAETLAVMRAALSYWHPDDSGQWLHGPLGMGQLLCWNTPESRRDSMPRVQHSAAGPLVITADVRLDNREELTGLLSAQAALAGRAPATITDTELLLAAYLEWGEASPARLLGDFAYTIWDGTRGELFCARDHLGIKPFYYRLDEASFVFANDIRGLAGPAGKPVQLDEKVLGSYLLDGELFDAELTFLAGVRKLPPATSLKISAEEVSRLTYWRAENCPPLQPDTLENYSNRLRDLLQEAVRVRLRTAYPVACHLSGGLDSAVVTMLAARMAQEQSQPLISYNWVHESGPEDNPAEAEWANSRELAGHAGIEHEYIKLSSQDLLTQLNAMDLATHTTSDAWYDTPLRQRARERQVGVILSGWGGDELISYSGRRRFSDAFWRGRVFAATGGIWRETRGQQRRFKRFLGQCYRELLKPGLDRVTRGDSQEDFLACARPQFAAAARTQERCTYDGRVLRVRDELLGFLRQGHLQNRTESWANAGRPDRIEYRFPLLDKRVVEFALGLPAACFRQQGSKRFLMRHSAGGLLPEALRWNDYKREPKRVERLLDLYRAAFPQWLRQARSDPGWAAYCAGHGTIDEAELARQIEALQGDEERSMQEKITLSKTILKSVLVLGAGRTFPAGAAVRKNT